MKGLEPDFIIYRTVFQNMTELLHLLNILKQTIYFCKLKTEHTICAMRLGEGRFPYITGIITKPTVLTNLTYNFIQNEILWSFALINCPWNFV